MCMKIPENLLYPLALVPLFLLQYLEVLEDPVDPVIHLFHYRPVDQAFLVGPALRLYQALPTA